MSKRQSRALARPNVNVPGILKGVDLQSIVNFLKVHVRHAPGCSVEWDTLYSGLLWYYPAPPTPIEWPDWVLETRELLPPQPEAPSAADFGAAIAFICNRAGIKIDAAEPARCLNVTYYPPGCAQAAVMSRASA